MQKTTFYFSLIYLALNNILFSQVNNQTIDKYRIVEREISTQNTRGYFLPVYYNFEKRQLLYGGTRKISGKDFLEICRQINDSLIQEQVELYDTYTRKKTALTVSAILLGASAYVMCLGSAVASDEKNSSMQLSLALLGVASLIATPVCAIGTSVPHAKRKEILFYSLPIAYNRFVESKNNVQPIANK